MSSYKKQSSYIFVVDTLVVFVLYFVHHIGCSSEREFKKQIDNNFIYMTFSTSCPCCDSVYSPSSSDKSTSQHSSVNAGSNFITLNLSFMRLLIWSSLSFPHQFLFSQPPEHTINRVVNFYFLLVLINLLSILNK